MAFTASEKRQIRSYLGYSGGYRDRGIALESMMDVVGDQVEESAYARELLDQIADVDSALASTGSSATSATYGAIKKAEDVEFYAPSEDGGSTTTSVAGVDWGEILIERLRALFDVPLASRYFRKSMRSCDPFPLG